jgi:hypothetical protein
MKNTILILAGIAIVYLLFVNKKAKDTVRAIATGVIPDVLTTSYTGTNGGSQVLLQSSSTPANVVVVTSNVNPAENLLGTNSSEQDTGSQMVFL